MEITQIIYFMYIINHLMNNDFHFNSMIKSFKLTINLIVVTFVAFFLKLISCLQVLFFVLPIFIISNQFHFLLILIYSHIYLVMIDFSVILQFSIIIIIL